MCQAKSSKVIIKIDLVQVSCTVKFSVLNRFSVIFLHNNKLTGILFNQINRNDFNISLVLWTFQISQVDQRIILF